MGLGILGRNRVWWLVGASTSDVVQAPSERESMMREAPTDVVLLNCSLIQEFALYQSKQSNS